MMGRWEQFLDSLATPGGAIFMLLFCVVAFSLAVVHIMHHPNYSEQMVTVFTGLLTGFAGALLGALTTRSKPNNGGTSTHIETTTSETKDTPKAT